MTKINGKGFERKTVIALSVCLVLVVGLSIGIIGTLISQHSTQLQIGQAESEIKDKNSFVVATVVMNKNTIENVYLNQFAVTDDSNLVAVPNEGLGKNLEEGFITSVRLNKDAQFDEFTDETSTSFIENLETVQNYVKGMSVSDLESKINASSDLDIGSHLIYETNYLDAIVSAANNAKEADKVGIKGSLDDVSMVQTLYAAHGANAFSITTILVRDDTVLLSYLDEYQFFNNTVVTPVLSPSNVLNNLALASKRENSEYYSSLMAEAGNATQTIIQNYKGIESFTQGKTLEEISTVLADNQNEEIYDVISSATLTSSYNYLVSYMNALKLNV